MVFFVDHQAVFFVRVDDNGPGAIGIGKLPADQLPLHQKLAIDRPQVLDVQIHEIAQLFGRRQFVVQERLDRRPVMVRTTSNEREVRQVTCKPNPTADDDVGLRPRAT